MHFKETHHIYCPFNPTQFSQLNNEILYIILHIFYETRKMYSLAPDFIFFYFSFISISWRLIFFLFVVNFVIQWNETAMGLHVFPILIPPPTSLSTRSP